MKNKSYHHHNLRQELIEKGLKWVDEKGMQSFSLRKIAEACGVSHAAPYSHFQNKEELLSAMQEHITNEFSERLEQTIDQYRNEPDVLDRLAQTYVMFFTENPHYASFLYTQSSIKIDLSLNADSTHNYQPFEIYKKLALEVMEQANVPKEKQKDAIISGWSLAHGIASIATMKNVHYDENWQDKIMDLMKFHHF